MNNVISAVVCSHFELWLVQVQMQIQVITDEYHETGPKNSINLLYSHHSPLWSLAVL